MDKRHILLVDDDPFVRRGVGRDLESEGYRVTTADSGERAIELLAATSFDLVLTDLIMGEVDGIQVLKKAREVDPEIITIILTGYGNLASAIDALRSGADDYLLKPCDVKELFFRLSRSLEKQDLSRQLLVQNRKLNQEIRERRETEKALRAFAENLTRSNRELHDFAHIASHDLQAPLMLIRAFGRRLRDNCGDILPKKEREYLHRIKSSAKRMQDLIDGLRSYSQTVQNSRPYVSVDLGEIVNEVLSDLEVLLERTGGRVEVGELAVIEADPVQMRQVFQNLIGNGLKFHRPDETPLVKIHSRLQREAVSGEQCVRICIEDNGTGFDEKYIEKMFTIFQRLPQHNQYEGTGVGLAICKRIVERLGGSITARSDTGHGATFIVTLPVRQTGEERGEARV